MSMAYFWAMISIKFDQEKFNITNLFMKYTVQNI